MKIKDGPNASSVKTSAMAEANRIQDEDRPVHDWYRFVLSYPPHLVRDYLARFEVRRGQVVLDPFCGTGTTPVECAKRGVKEIGVEANPMAWFASRTKLDWTPDPDQLLEYAAHVAKSALAALESDGVADDAPWGISRLRKTVRQAGGVALRALDPELTKLLLANSISPRPLHKTLVLLDAIQSRPDCGFADHGLLALAQTVVASASNLHFGPEVGVGPPKNDAPVVAPWLAAIARVAADLRAVQERKRPRVRVIHGDARQIAQWLKPNSIDAVITSPPYPNEKDYTRTTRLESVLLGFVRNKQELQALKKGLVRSNTRGVYKGDDDDQWIAKHPEIHRIARDIEARRIELGKTSGFERLYARVTKLYFGGMARHLAELRPALRPGAQLAYVVGDQASYLRVMIRTGQLLAEIATALGYELLSIDLFRTRLATASKEQLREEVVVLRWPG